MTIAFITPEYPHPRLNQSAGLGSSIRNLAKGLISKRISVVVFVAFQNKNEILYEDGITIISIARRGYRFFGWYLERKHIERQIKNHMSREQIDVLEAPDWTGITAFTKYKIPLLIRLHGSDAYFCHLEGRKQKWKNFFLEKRALKNADAIVSVSLFTAQKTKYIFGLSQNIKTIYNSIDTAKFSPVNNPVVENELLYFGTIIRKKGVLELAKAFNIVIENNPDATLKLIGRDVTDVFERISTLKLFFSLLTPKAKKSVIHLQEVDYKEIKYYIAEASVVVLPSFAEAFPMTWLETLALEKPLISSNIGWAKELMIHNRTGYMVNPKDCFSLADAILDLLKDPEKRITFGSNGRQHILQNFSTEIVLEQNIKLYNNLIESA